jgi:hypothetical protein
MGSLKLLILLLFITLPAFAVEERHQILSDAFEKVMVAEDLACDVKIQLVTSDENQKRDLQYGSIRKKKGNLLQRLGNRQTLVTVDAVVLVDLKKKIMRYVPRKTSDLPSNAKSFDTEWKEWAGRLGEFEYGGKSQGFYHFVLPNIAQVITRVDIFISEDTGSLMKIEYTYDSSYTGPVEKAVIQYIWQNLKVLEQTNFSLSQYIEFDRGKPKPSENYSDFRLISSE